LRDNAQLLPPRARGSGAAHVVNREAVIPPQCYTKTEGKFNPCYVCHQNEISGRENRMNDGQLQIAYSFSETGKTNHWNNLHEDRRAQVEQISDNEILEWISADNFSRLSDQLENAEFRGFIPKLENLAQGASAFDERGIANDGSHWIAFNYKPMPSTFWPTNGSTDDVMIRLPAKFRENEKGAYSTEIYMANLAVLEAAIKGFSKINTIPINETRIQIDVNGDNQLQVVHNIKKPDHYFGNASSEKVVDFIYPEGTEFLHTVRYIGVTPDGQIYNAPRMKEVRYMVKTKWLPETVLAHYYDEEYQEKLEGTLPHYPDRAQSGLYNKMGWHIQGFIEDKDGHLRFNTYEETMFCMGCHTTIGSTIDKTFSFPRKIDGAAGWGYINLKGMPDAPNYGEKDGEILTYLSRVGGGTEFRNNPEMAKRWYNADHSVNRTAVKNALDVYELITPSPKRALQLNKAYRVIVKDQDFIYGRDASIFPVETVYDKVPEDAPTLPTKNSYDWDIRLDWTE